MKGGSQGAENEDARRRERQGHPAAARRQMRAESRHFRPRSPPCTALLCAAQRASISSTISCAALFTAAWSTTFFFFPFLPKSASISSSSCKSDEKGEGM